MAAPLKLFWYFGGKGCFNSTRQSYIFPLTCVFWQSSQSGKTGTAPFEPEWLATHRSLHSWHIPPSENGNSLLLKFFIYLNEGLHCQSPQNNPPYATKVEIFVTLNHNSRSVSRPTRQKFRTKPYSLFTEHFPRPLHSFQVLGIWNLTPFQLRRPL